MTVERTERSATRPGPRRGVPQFPAATIAILGPGDAAILGSAVAGVFDGTVERALAAEFLADPRHHIAVAMVDSRVVGFASAVHYVHPDKRPELWINEVGVATAWRRRGLGRALLEAVLQVGRELGCDEAWVLAERANRQANGLYRGADGPQRQTSPRCTRSISRPSANDLSGSRPARARPPAIVRDSPLEVGWPDRMSR